MEKPEISLRLERGQSVRIDERHVWQLWRNVDVRVQNGQASSLAEFLTSC